ncbi:MAG: hypothetical protein IJJ42_09725 [Clostridia bacterium]|nr:hypothetical protein [Clostridia bacterium]
MKKLISVLLTIALLMMTAAVSAEAVGSKTAEDIAAAGVITTEGNEDAQITVEIVKAGEAVAALQTKFAEAVKAGDLSSVLPKDVLSAIPAEFLAAESLADNLKEMVALKISGDAEGVTAFTFGLELETPYEEGTDVYVLFGIFEGEEVKEWMLKKGTVKEGKVTVTLTADDLTKVLNKGEIATLIFSK